MAPFSLPVPSASPLSWMSPCIGHLCQGSDAGWAWLRTLCFSGPSLADTAWTCDHAQMMWYEGCTSCPDRRSPLRTAIRGKIIFFCYGQMFQGARLRLILTGIEFLNKKLSLTKFLLERKMRQGKIFDFLFTTSILERHNTDMFNPSKIN